jgi:hypothetical protein
MRPVPLWRLAPFRDPVAFDMNLCTDSVLPGLLHRSGYAASELCGRFSPAFLEYSTHGMLDGAVSLPLHRSAILQS